jgi:sugar phosphate isomerase/epimerase
VQVYRGDKIMDFGMPTLIEYDTLVENAKLSKEVGLDFIELNMNLPQYTLERLKEIQYLKALSEEYGHYYTIHLEENLNICEFNQGVAKAYENTVYETIETALALRVPLLNMHMHSGIYITLPDRKVYLYEKYKDIYLKKLEVFRDKCRKLIGSSSLVISLENTDGFRPFQREGIELLLESKVFTLTWDIGHSHAANGIDEEFLLEHKTRLQHFHIHDGLGKQNHMTLGQGEINLAERLSLAEETGSRCVLETKTAESLRVSVDWLKVRSYI